VATDGSAALNRAAGLAQCRQLPMERTPVVSHANLRTVV
jgi:hypothetical protein